MGPQAIEFDRGTRAYRVTLPGPIEDAFYNQDDPRIFEIYVSRLQIEKIPYGQESNDRIKVSQLELAHAVPMDEVPDPRVIIEDAADFEKDAKKKHA